MNKNRVVLFAPEGPNFCAEGVVTFKFFNLLKKQGYDVVWLYHMTEAYYGNAKTYGNENLIGISNVGFENCFLLFKNIPVLKHLSQLNSLLWSYKAYKIAKRMHKENAFILTFSRIMPRYGHLPALFFTQKVKIPWIANWSDPMPLAKSPVPYGKGALCHISRFNRIYLNAIRRHASAHTFPSEWMKNYYLRYLPLTKQACFVIPHIAIQKTPIAKPKNQSLTIIHSGWLGLRSPYLLLKALRNSLKKDANKDIPVKLIFIGAVEENVKKWISEFGLEQITTCTGKISYEESLAYNDLADILLVVEAIMDEGIFFPSKVTDIVGGLKPIFSISPPKGVMNDLISQHKGGIVVDCKSLRSIEEGLDKLLEDWKTNQLEDDQYNSVEIYNQLSEDSVGKLLQKIIHILNQ